MVFWVIYLSVGPNKARPHWCPPLVRLPPGVAPPHGLSVGTPRLLSHGGSPTAPRELHRGLIPRILGKRSPPPDYGGYPSR